MEIHQHLCTIGHKQSTLVGNTRTSQHLTFFKKGRNVDHHPIAQHSCTSRMQNSTWNLIELERFIAHNDGMTRICTSLATCHH